MLRNLIRLEFYDGMERREGMMIEYSNIKVQEQCVRT